MHQNVNPCWRHSSMLAFSSTPPWNNGKLIHLSHFCVRYPPSIFILYRNTVRISADTQANHIQWKEGNFSCVVGRWRWQEKKRSQKLNNHKLILLLNWDFWLVFGWDAFVDCVTVCPLDAMIMEGSRSAFPTSSSSITHSCTSASDQVHNSNVEPEDGRGSRAGPEVGAAEGGNGNGGGANCRSGGELLAGRGGASQETQPHHQMTPSKRSNVLNISPPPLDLLDDSKMSCQDETSRDSEQSSSIWMEDSRSNFSIMSTSSYNDNTEVPRKSRKRTPRQRPGPKSAPAEEASMDVFDADSAKGPHFVLSQLGPDSKTGTKGRFVVLF